MHDVRFHRAVAGGCGNRVLAALMEMVSAQFYELRRQTIAQARDLRESAEMHRRVYRAIRSHNTDAARAEMTEHLRAAQHAQTLEPVPPPPRCPRPRAAASRTNRRRTEGRRSAAWVTPLWT